MNEYIRLYSVQKLIQILIYPKNKERRTPKRYSPETYDRVWDQVKQNIIQQYIPA